MSEAPEGMNPAPEVPEEVPVPSEEPAPAEDAAAAETETPVATEPESVPEVDPAVVAAKEKVAEFLSGVSISGNPDT